MKPADHRRTHRFFWRLFLHGVLLLLTIFVATIITFSVSEKEPQWRRVSRNVSEWLAESAEDRGSLQEKLILLERISESSIAVFNLEGSRLAASGTEVFEPLEKDELTQLVESGTSRRIGHHKWVSPLHVAGELQGYLIVEHGALKSTWTTFVSVLVLVIIIIILFSAPLAYSLSKPIVKLTGTARKLAAGDFDARSGIKRKDEIGTLADTLDEMAAKIQSLRGSEKELLANVSHEIRTPLSRIKVAVELCEEEQQSIERVRTHLKGISSDVSELGRLIDDVLDLTRLEMAEHSTSDGTITLRREAAQIKELLREVINRVESSHPDKTIRLADTSTRSEMQVDKTLIKRMYQNLLDNACKYTEGDEPIEVVLAETNRQITVSIMDRGIGVAPADIGRIFEPFFRGDRSRNKTIPGMGLGLALAKKIAESHGGRIQASIRPKGGTVFAIELPK